MILEIDKQKEKIELIKKGNELARWRLEAAIVQALLTGINLVVSVTILFHLLGG